MNELTDFFGKLFDSADWPPRWHCGQWSSFHGWLYIVSDLLIWAAYFTIPIVILRYISKKQGIKFLRLYFLFAAFILACGATHLLDAIAFWIPLYRLNALVLFITGVISWVTVFYLIKNLPLLFSMQSQKALESEIELRKRSEEKFKGLLEAAPDAMVIVNEKGEIVLINRQTEILFGYTKEELTGRQVETLVPADLRDRHVDDRSRYFSNPKVRVMGAGLALYAVKKDGTQIPVEISLSPLETEEGTLISASVRDITERKRSEERIRFLASIADHIQDPVISTDNDSNITRWNKPAEELFEWKSDEVIGKNVTELLRVNYIDERMDLVFEFLKRKRSFWQGEVIYYKKSGIAIHALITASHLKDAEGNIIGNLILARDITLRKKAENELSKLNLELEARVQERTEAVVKTMEEKNIILESIGDAFFAVDKNWTVTYWNRMAEKDLSVPKENIVGNNLWEIFSDSIESVSYKKYHEAMATNQVVHFEDYYAALNKWYEISAYPSGNGLSVYFKDITERKKAAEEIAKLNSELEERVLRRTEQLKKSTEEMEAFSYSISHDLRAPLRGIIGFTNILEEDYGGKLDDEAIRITTVIKKNTTRMGMLIDDLLSFSRMGRKELMKTNVDSNKLVKDVIAEVDANRKKIEWIVHPLPFIKADANTLKQVWINLISNAVKYSGNADKPKIEIGSTQKNGSIAFFIKDNGVGFDEKYKAKLFKVFQRLHTNEEFEGTGIGLAIVDKIISKHGGEVWVEAELNKGATFYFSLPVDKE